WRPRRSRTPERCCASRPSHDERVAPNCLTSAVTQRLRTVIATPLERELVELIARDERLEVVWEPELLSDPEIDWMAGPKQRTPEEQARYERLLDSAEVLFGVPDQSGRGLARPAPADPAARWGRTRPPPGGPPPRAPAAAPPRAHSPS